MPSPSLSGLKGRCKHMFLTIATYRVAFMAHKKQSMFHIWPRRPCIIISILGDLHDAESRFCKLGAFCKTPPGIVLLASHTSGVIQYGVPTIIVRFAFASDFVHRNQSKAEHGSTYR